LKTFILFLGLAGAAGSMLASPVLYNFNFTGGTPNATGSFDYDSSAISNPFSVFTVAFSGATFDFTSVANGETGIGCGGATGPQSLFNALVGDTFSGCGIQTWVAEPFGGPEGFSLLDDTNTNLTTLNNSGSTQVQTRGTFTATAAAPEPATWALFFAGAGALLSWKRIRRSR